MSDYFTAVATLEADDYHAIMQGRRFRYGRVWWSEYTTVMAVAKSTTDTSAAARRRKTHYDRMD